MARIGFRPLHARWSQPYDFFSPHRDTVHFVFADGAVHALSVSTSVEVLKALSTRAEGTPVDDSAY